MWLRGCISWHLWASLRKNNLFFGLFGRHLRFIDNDNLRDYPRDLPRATPPCHHDFNLHSPRVTLWSQVQVRQQFPPHPHRLLLGRQCLQDAWRQEGQRWQDNRRRFPRHVSPPPQGPPGSPHSAGGPTLRWVTKERQFFGTRTLTSVNTAFAGPPPVGAALMGWPIQEKMVRPYAI